MSMSELKSPAIQNWLGNLAESTQLVQDNYFKCFMKWVRASGPEPFRDMTPDEILEYQKPQEYEILDKLVKPYVRQARGTYNTKNSRYNNIRSFFAHNRKELPKDKTFKIRPELEAIKGTLTAQEIRDNILACNPMYQAVFLSMFQSAMDQEGFTYWNTNGYDSLMQQLEENKQIIKIDLPGRKGKKNIAPFYTFIGRDAIAAIKTWLKHRDELVRVGKISKDNKTIFVTKHLKAPPKRSMREYWLSHLRKLGIVEPIKRGTKATKTGKGLHEMRDVWRSLWDNSSAKHVVAEYLMGHQIDRLEYNKSFRDTARYEAEYKKALPYFELLTGGDAYNLVDKSEVDRQRDRIKELEVKVEDLKVMLVEARADQVVAAGLEARLDMIEKRLNEK